MFECHQLLGLRRRSQAGNHLACPVSDPTRASFSSANPTFPRRPPLACRSLEGNMPRKPPPAELDISAWLRALPKVELHLHLEGTIEPETLVALSQRHDATPLTLPDARALYTYRNFLGFLDAFKAVSARLQTPDDYELITYNMVRTLAAQGVVHAEVYISFGIIYYWKQTDVEPFVAAIERARIRAQQEFGTTIYWLIDAVRNFGPDEAARVFRKAAELSSQYPSLVGIGIGGDRS